MNKRVLFWSVIAWIFLMAGFFGHQFFGIMNEEFISHSEGRTNRLGEYGFYLVFLAGLFLLKFWLDKKRSSENKQESKGFLFLLKTLVASYAISFVVSILVLGLIYITLSSAIFDTAMHNLQLIIFTITLILCPIVYRKIV